MTVKDVCKLVNELRPDVDITVAGVFGEGINDRAWCYSTIYDSKPPNFEKLATKNKEVSAIEIVRGPELNDESMTVCFDMNKKEDNTYEEPEDGERHLLIQAVKEE